MTSYILDNQDHIADKTSSLLDLLNIRQLSALLFRYLFAIKEVLNVRILWIKKPSGLTIYTIT